MSLKATITIKISTSVMTFTHLNNSIMHNYKIENPILSRFIPLGESILCHCLYTLIHDVGRGNIAFGILGFIK